MKFSGRSHLKISAWVRTNEFLSPAAIGLFFFFELTRSYAQRDTLMYATRQGEARRGKPCMKEKPTKEKFESSRWTVGELSIYLSSWIGIQIENKGT